MALLVVSSFALAPSIAAGAACPSADTSYVGNCGPEFAVPNWTDAGGWTDPSQYSTIQLADVNGDGKDELIGRNDEGLEIWWFDPTAGVTVERLLFEPRGHGELTIPHGRAASRPLKLKLRRAGSGRFTAATTSRRRRVRIEVRRVGRGAHVELNLRVRAPAFRAPRRCHALPASVALHTSRMKLQTRLAIGAGRTHRRLVLFHHVRCRRDTSGNIDRLEFVHFRDYPLRSGLAVTVRGPSRVRAGTTVRYVARVHNRRRGRHRLVSSLWDITLHTGTRERRIHELRRGRSRSVTFTRRVPRTARRRFCVSALAVGPGLRAAADRTCSSVRAARAPAFTG